MYKSAAFAIQNQQYLMKRSSLETKLLQHVYIETPSCADKTGDLAKTLAYFSGKQHLSTTDRLSRTLFVEAQRNLAALGV